MNRRQFIQNDRSTSRSRCIRAGVFAGAADKELVTARRLPRWRGFNLLAKFTKQSGGNPPFSEADFALLAEWGFNFTRLPLSYLCWTDPRTG